MLNDIFFDARSIHMLCYMSQYNRLKQSVSRFPLCMLISFEIKTAKILGIHYKQAACLLFNEIIIRISFVFLLNKRSPEDAAW